MWVTSDSKADSESEIRTQSNAMLQCNAAVQCCNAIMQCNAAMQSCNESECGIESGFKRLRKRVTGDPLQNPNLNPNGNAMQCNAM